MINVRDLYNENEGEWSDYQPLINAFGNIVIQVDDDDYEGDTRVLYDNEGKIGHLIFGWGSCSGCDALQACEDLNEVQELCNELESNILWLNNKKEALDWFKNHDWEGDWCWDSNTKEFINQVIKYLEKGKE